MRRKIELKLFRLGLAVVLSLTSLYVQAGTVTLNASAAENQSGVFVKYVYSVPLPSDAKTITGMGGTVSNYGIGGGLSETLFVVGYLPSGGCPADGSAYTDYSQIYAAMPGLVVLGTFMVKSFNYDYEYVPTNINLPVGLPVSGGCAFVILDEGNPENGGTVLATSNIDLYYNSDTSSTAYQVGPGDEFCTGYGSGCQLSTTATTGSFVSTTLISTPGTLTALYGDISAGALMANYGYTWGSDHQFYIDRGCSQYAAPGGYAVYGPVAQSSLTPPSSAVNLMTANLRGPSSDLQSLLFQPMRVYVNAGDCLVHTMTTAGIGGVDTEMQVHALILPGSSLIGLDGNPGYSASPMWRFYNSATHEHFFTASYEEGFSAGFAYEGIAFYFLDGSGMPNTTPIYRCYDGSKHFISVDAGCEGASSEGKGCTDRFIQSKCRGHRPSIVSSNRPLGITWVRWI